MEYHMIQRWIKYLQKTKKEKEYLHKINLNFTGWNTNPKCNGIWFSRINFLKRVFNSWLLLFIKELLIDSYVNVKF